jgi:hypothetical protein
VLREPLKTLAAKFLREAVFERRDARGRAGKPRGSPGAPAPGSPLGDGPPKPVFVFSGSPAGLAWASEYREKRGLGVPWSKFEKGFGFYFPTLWPPGREPREPGVGPAEPPAAISAERTEPIVEPVAVPFATA